MGSVKKGKAEQLRKMFSGEPGQWDPAMGKVFGVNEAQFEETDALRVETEKQLLWEAENRYQIVCQVRDSIREFLDEPWNNVGENTEEAMEKIKEWYDELEAVTKNG